MESAARRIFFSWQSDTRPAKTNRTLIGDALSAAAKSLSAEWAPSDRPGVQTASSDVVGARALAEVILERIRSADAFVADVSLVVKRGARKMPNPNVLIETGYALHALGEARVVLVLNLAHGSVEDLPFDLRGRLALTYSMAPADAPAAARSQLAKDLSGALKPMLTLPRTTADVRVDVGLYDVASPNLRGASVRVFAAYVRNFADFPLRLTHVGFGFRDGAGAILPGLQGAQLARPIPPRDSTVFTVPAAIVIESEKPIANIVVTDSLGRTWKSEPGAVSDAIAASRA